MFEVKFTTFSKRENSTKRPDTWAATLNCKMLEPSTVTTPRLEIVGVVNVQNYTYAYIAAFSRYYFVKEWTNDGVKWIVDLVVDVLASYKTEIEADSRYVLRSGQDYNYRLMDRAYSVTSEVENIVNTAGALYGDINSDGVYVMTMVSLSMPANTSGGVLYYAVTPTMFTTFLQQIRNWFIQLTQGDILSKITNVIWLPIAYSSILATEYNFQEPVFGLDVTGKVLNETYNRIWATSREIAIPRPSWYTSVDRMWSRYAPFAAYTLQCMPFGIIPLDSLAIINANNVRLTMTVDMWSGQARLDVELTMPASAPNIFLTHTTAQLGVPIRIAQAMFNSAAGLAGIGSVATLAAGVASENPGLIASGAASLVGSAASASIPQVSTSGSTGSLISIAPIPKLHCKFYKPADDDHEEIGYPLEETRQLGTLSGFIQCAHGDIEYGGFYDEKKQLSKYLTGGFFHE